MRFLRKKGLIRCALYYSYGKSTIRVILNTSNLQFHKKVVELIYTNQFVTVTVVTSCLNRS